MRSRALVPAVLAFSVLAACSETHYGLPEEAEPVVEQAAPPPPPEPLQPVKVMYPASVKGMDAEQLLAGDVWALRFLALRQLAEARIIPPEEAEMRATANLGALLPLTKVAPAGDLDRPIPPLSQILATARSFPPGSNALGVVLDSLLPKAPAQRTLLGPHTKDAARKVRARLSRLDATGLISPAERAAEEDALDALLNSNRLAETTMLPPPPPPPEKPKPKGHGGGAGGHHRGSEPLYVPDPSNFQTQTLDPKATGPAGLYLMQVPDPSQADKAWTMLKTQHAELVPLGVVLVKTDLGDVGVTWRLVAGPVPAEDARKLCDGIRPKNYDCTPIPYPKNGSPIPAPKAGAAAPVAEQAAPSAAGADKAAPPPIAKIAPPAAEAHPAAAAEKPAPAPEQPGK